MRSVYRSVVSGIAALALLAPSVAPGLAAEPISRADFDACQGSDEASFRAAVEAITLKALRAGTQQIDYAAAVGEQWRSATLDDVIDRQVDKVVAEVTDEKSFVELWSTLANSDKAQELARTVAERVYRSDALKKAIEGLATGVGRTVGKSIEKSVVDAEEPALKCMQTFLGPRYGTQIARSVAADAGKEFKVDPTRNSAEVSTGAVVAQSGDGIAGAVVLLVRRQLANMAARVGQRLVGAVLSRLVSLVAGGIGVVLIAKDVWDLRHGAMPIIASEMKSKSSKDAVQAELAKTIGEQINEHIKEVAEGTAGRVVEIWHEFKRAHQKVLEIAERDGAFRKFLDATSPALLARLDETVALIVAAEGEAGVLKRLADGSLDRAVNKLPAAGMEIARETRSVAAALAWADLAGSDLAAVQAFGIHMRAKPADFTPASLRRVLGVRDKAAIERLSGLSRPARDTLLALPDADLAKLARALDGGELATLASYLTGLDKPAGQRVLAAVAGEPARMRVIASPNVRDAILASRDQGAAVDMMLRTGGPVLSPAVLDDFRLAYDGRVSPILLAHRHPAALGVATFLIIILLGMLRRLFRPRRAVAA